MFKSYSNYIKKLKNTADELKVFDDKGKILDIDQTFDNWISKLQEINKSTRKKIIFIGNGGSAGIASHCATDSTGRLS